jgi:DNA-binding beta-propeller fold protein YncE
MNFGQARMRLVHMGAVLAAAVLVAGCGNNYRPAVTTTSPSGPASQVESYAAVVSSSSTTAAGVATIFDYSGDSLLAKATIGVGPTSFTLDPSGSSGYTLNSDHTLTYFPVSSKLQTKNESYTTLPSTAQPVNLFSPSSGLWAADLCGTASTTTECTSWDDDPASLNFSGADVFSNSPETWQVSIPLAPTPVMVAGPSSSASRYFGISQGNSAGYNGNSVAHNVSSAVACNASPSTVTVNGEADGIGVSSRTISSYIPLGKCPVYALESSDAARLFVLNRGSDTISVIDTAKDALDSCDSFVETQTGRTVTCHPTLPLSTTALTATGITPVNCTLSTDPTCGGMTATAGPVYAEYNIAKSLLVVANYDGGTISVIDVSLDEYGNDSATFGTTYTIKVGTNPASVTVLYDGSRAYVANQADQTVTIVYLDSHTVEKTLAVTGYPRTVVSTQNSSYGKVYVASPNSNVLTIIRTDEDIVDTAPTVTGNIVDVRVSTANGTSGTNANYMSRAPGYGQPCNLPGAAYTASLDDCKRVK